jgi:hypothetical protein
MACAESDAPATRRWAATPAVTNGASSSHSAHVPPTEPTSADAKSKSRAKASSVPRTQDQQAEVSKLRW